jgi:hypothetical protein
MEAAASAVTVQLNVRSSFAAVYHAFDSLMHFTTAASSFLDEQHQ